MRKSLLVLGAVSAMLLMAGVISYLIGHRDIYMCSGLSNLGEVYCESSFVLNAQNLVALGEALFVLSLVGFVSTVFLFTRRIAP